MIRWAAIVTGAALLLSGCDRRQPPPVPTPTPSPTPTRAPVPAATSATGTRELPAPELDGAVTAPGAWRFQVSADGDQAVYGVTGKPSLFAMRCDRAAGMMVFTRPVGAAGPVGDTATLRLILRDGATTLYTQPAHSGRVEAREPATDTFLTDVLADAKGPIGVKLGDGPTLALPYDAVVGQTIRRCAAPKG